MNIFLFSFCCILAISAVTIGILALSINQKCRECVNNPSVWCYNDWTCSSGSQPKEILDNILGTDSTLGLCTRDPVNGTACPCPSTANWPTAPNTGPNGNYGAKGGTYNPSLSNGIDVCSTFQ